MENATALLLPKVECLDIAKKTVRCRIRQCFVVNSVVVLFALIITRNIENIVY